MFIRKHSSPLKASILIRFQIDFYLLYLLATTTYAGVSTSKLIENEQEDYNWELAWNHTNHRNPPWQGPPIKQIRKRPISEVLTKEQWKKVTNFDWVAKPLSPALLDIFLLNQKTKKSKKYSYIRYLPLYRTGEEFPCAVIFESPDFTKIVEAVPPDRFYKNSTISIYGKFPANTVDYKSRIFLNLTMLPQVLSTLGLNIPDEAQIAFSKSSATIRVNRFYRVRISGK